MTFPTWLDPVDVTEHVGGVGGAPQDVTLDRYAAAAAAYVERHRPDLDYDTDNGSGQLTGDVPDDVRLATLMLTARLYARRGTALGVQGLGDGIVAYVARTDPDIVGLLGTGVHTLPSVG